MYFPAPIPFYPFWFAGSLLFALMGGGFSYHLAREQRAKRQPLMNSDFLMYVGFMLMGTVHACIAAFLWVSWEADRFDPTRIVEVQVVALGPDGLPSGETFTITDRKLLIAGFRPLVHAGRYNRRISGPDYRMRLRLENESTYSSRDFRFFRVKGEREHVAVIQLGLDTYASPAFGQWVAKNVDPHFQNTRSNR